MCLPRALKQLICRVLIGVFLFAQLAVSAYACPGHAQAMPKVAEMAPQHADPMPAGCDQIDRKAPNLCAEHCKAGQQSSDTAPTPAVSAPTLALLYVLPDVTRAAAGSVAPGRTSDPLPSAAPPPHAILHCVLRI